MIDKVRKVLSDTADTIKEQAANLGEGAKEKSRQLIDDWMTIFPKLVDMGFEITSFSLSMGLSPALEVELKGNHEDFPIERLKQLATKHKGKTTMVSVLTTIKNTYQLHDRLNVPLRSPLIVKVKVKLAPEIKVYIGEPIIE